MGVHPLGKFADENKKLSKVLQFMKFLQFCEF